METLIRYLLVTGVRQEYISAPDWDSARNQAANLMLEWDVSEGRLVMEQYHLVNSTPHIISVEKN